jgi:hypothetical protein
VLGEGSGFDKGIYIWRVVMPLFVPSEHVVLSWSERIGGGARKYNRFDEAAMATAIADAIEGLPEGEDEALGQLVARDDPASPNRRLHETTGYAHLLLGDLPAARESLSRAATGVPTAAWGQDVIDRARLISRLLEEEGRDRAVDHLDMWCKQTAGALGLRRSRVSDAQA